MKTQRIKISLTLLMVFLLSSAYANDATGQEVASSLSWLDWTLNNLVLIVGAIAAIGAVGAILHLNNQLMELNRIRVLREHGIEIAEKLDIAPANPMWQRWYKKMTRVVPIEQEADVMLDHDYDGIRELDNILPPWWVGMFYATIIIGIAYFSYYHITDSGLSSAEEYALELEEADAAIKAYLATKGDQVDESNVVRLTDANELALGETIFVNKCAVCHANDGGGGVGPNLTDKYWLHGGDIKDVFTTVKYGVPEKGMISWKSQLRATDMQRVSSYILTLVGTTPASPKDPEGDLYEETEQGETVADDVKAAQIGMNQ